MSPTTRKWLRGFFLVLAFLTGFVGIMIMTVWNRALSSDLYTEAFKQSGIYEETTNIVENQVSYYLVQRGDEVLEELKTQVDEEEDEGKRAIKNILLFTIGMVVENNTSTVVSNVSEKLNVEENMELVSEAVISESLAWLRGDAEDPKIFAYIPSVEDVENFERERVVTDSISSVVYSALGFTDLEVCNSDSKVTEALKQIEGGKWLEITCTSGSIEEAVKEKIGSILPVDAINEFKSNLEDSYVAYGLETLFEGIYNITLNASKLKEGMINFRTEIQAIRYTGLGILLLSLMFTAAATLVSEHKTIKTFLRTYFAVGGVLLIWVLLFNTVAVELAFEELNFDSIKLTGDAISSAQASLWLDSVKSSTRFIMEHLHDYTIDAAIVILFATGVPLIAIYFYQHGGAEMLANLWDKVSGYFNRLTGRVNTKEN